MKVLYNQDFILNRVLTPREIGVNLKQGYNGDLTSKQAGSVGGEMVKRLVANAANQMQSQQPNQ